MRMRKGGSYRKGREKWKVPVIKSLKECERGKANFVSRFLTFYLCTPTRPPSLFTLARSLLVSTH